MLSCRAATAAMPAVRAFLDGLHCFTLAESLGGVESLVAHPATMTHAAMSPKRAPPPASAMACCACRSGIEARGGPAGRPRRRRLARAEHAVARRNARQTHERGGAARRGALAPPARRGAARVALLGHRARSAARCWRAWRRWRGTPLGAAACAGARGQFARSRAMRPLGTDAAEALLADAGAAAKFARGRRRRAAAAMARASSSTPPPATQSPRVTRTGSRAASTSPPPARSGRARRWRAGARSAPPAPASGARLRRQRHRRRRACRCCARCASCRPAATASTRIAGVLSGSLAWLFNHYDGMRPFSALVREARDAGYTEPDPRDDLSGEDVRRKLLILARTAGVELDADEVEVDLAGAAGTGDPVARRARRRVAGARYAAARALRRGLQARREAALHRATAGWPRACRAGIAAARPSARRRRRHRQPRRDLVRPLLRRSRW